MERVTNANLIEFYNGKKICRINPIDGDDEIYVFVTKVVDDIVVKKVICYMIVLIRFLD